MKIGFVVNDVKTEETGYTTSRLGVAAINLGHEVWVMGVGDLAYDPDDAIRARARSVPKKKYSTSESYLRDLQGRNAIIGRITVDELDVLLLRNDPASDVIYRPWAVAAPPRISAWTWPMPGGMPPSSFTCRAANTAIPGTAPRRTS